MLITEQNKELILEQGINRLPGGKMFLGLAKKLGIQPDPMAFIDFTTMTTKNAIKFFKDKLAGIAKYLAGSLAGIATTAYTYYGYANALSNKIEVLLDKISDNSRKFRDQLVEKTNLYSEPDGNLDTLFSVLALEDESPYKDIIDAIIKELQVGFFKDLAQTRIKRILKNIEDENLRSEYEGFFDFTNVSRNNINALQKRIVLNNLELRTGFHKRDGHPFMWLVVIYAESIPINDPSKGRAKTSTLNWTNAEMIPQETGLSLSWLQRGIKASAIRSLAEAITTNNELRTAAKQVLEMHVSPLKGNDQKEIIKVLSTMEYNIQNGLIFFGNEQMIKNIINDIFVQPAKGDSQREELVKQTLQALPENSALRTLLTNDIKGLPKEEPEEVETKKEKYTSEEIGAARLIGSMINYQYNGANWKALINKPIKTTKALTRVRFLQQGPKQSDKAKIKRLFKTIEPFNTLKISDDVIDRYIEYMSGLWKGLRTQASTLDDFVRGFSYYTEHFIDSSVVSTGDENENESEEEKKEISEITFINNTLIFETYENEYLIPQDKFLKIYNVNSNNTNNHTLFEFNSDKIFNVKLDKVLGFIHLKSQEWEYIAKYLH